MAFLSQLSETHFACSSGQKPLVICITLRMPFAKMACCLDLRHARAVPRLLTSPPLLPPCPKPPPFQEMEILICIKLRVITQRLRVLPHCKRVLYYLSHQKSFCFMIWVFGSQGCGSWLLTRDQTHTALETKVLTTGQSQLSSFRKYFFFKRSWLWGTGSLSLLGLWAPGP